MRENIMKSSLALFLVAVIGLITLYPEKINASEVEFNYEGRISENGLPYTGKGYFKFAIITESTSLSLWSNDGTSTIGDEPTSSVITDVTDGLFNIIIGDTSLLNMAPISPAVFNFETDYYLRIWFSSSNDNFELFTPDRKITDAKIIGLQSVESIDIYVNPGTGNDNNVGISPTKPKQTIQAAWDSLPSLISKNTNIHLADGFYPEQVLLKGKTVVRDATISIVGNRASPLNVVVSGSDNPTTISMDREYGFQVIRQEDLFVAGITFKYCSITGLQVTDWSGVTIRDCNFLNNGNMGLQIIRGGRVEGINLEIAHSSGVNKWGVNAKYQAYVKLYDCNIHHCQDYGVVSNYLSEFQVHNLLVSDCSTAIQCRSLGHFTFLSNSTIKDCSVGLEGSLNSVIEGLHGFCTYNNVPVTEDITSGAETYN